MKDTILTSDGVQTLDKIIAIWPAIMRQGRRERILQLLSLMMPSKGIAEAGKDEVIEAVRMIVPKSYDPFFHMMEDMEKFKRLTLDTFEDRDAYNALPIKVRRWERATTEKSRKPSAQMKVTAFCASPRKDGNTDLLIEEVLKGVSSVGAQGEKIILQRIKMGFCIGCRRCKDTDYKGICTVKDDMAHLYQKIIDSDAIIIGFPIYTGRECAQLSTFLDRWDCFERFKFQAKLEPGRRALVIGTWGYPYIDTYDHVMENVMVVLKLHKVETVEALSACGFEGILHGLDEQGKGVIAKFPDELRKAYEAGVGLVSE
jgi:multimeric flavodoxin WrbA